MHFEAEVTKIFWRPFWWLDEDGAVENVRKNVRKCLSVPNDGTLSFRR